MPIRFPRHNLTLQDPTELAMHAVIDVVCDFEHALVTATTVSQVWQVRDRLKVCIALLAAVEDAATQKIDRLSEEKN